MPAIDLTKVRKHRHGLLPDAYYICDAAFISLSYRYNHTQSLNDLALLECNLQAPDPSSGIETCVNT